MITSLPLTLRFENSVSTKKTEVKERKEPSNGQWYEFPQIQKISIINRGNDNRNELILMSLNFV